MSPNNVAYLTEHYHIWQTLRDGGYCRNLSNGIKEELLRIYREEWDSRMMANLACDSCVADLVRATFYQFDIYLNEKKKEPAVQELSIRELAKVVEPKKNKPKINQK
jgi:hypothetical protein